MLNKDDMMRLYDEAQAIARPYAFDAYVVDVTAYQFGFALVISLRASKAEGDEDSFDKQIADHLYREEAEGILAAFKNYLAGEG